LADPSLNPTQNRREQAVAIGRDDLDTVMSGATPRSECRHWVKRYMLFAANL
jgi:hypothetical protein